VYIPQESGLINPFYAINIELAAIRAKLGCIFNNEKKLDGTQSTQLVIDLITIQLY